MKTFLLVLFLCGSIGLSAQTDFDQRLLAKFSEEQIADLQEDHSSVIEYWEYYLDNSFEIVTIPGQKSTQGFETVEIDDPNNFNVLNSGLNMARYASKTYRIAGTNKLLVLMGNDAFSKKFNAYRSKK
jgi:hypothetical protein